MINVLFLNSADGFGKYAEKHVCNILIFLPCGSFCQTIL